MKKNKVLIVSNELDQSTNEVIEHIIDLNFKVERLSYVS